MLNMENKYTKNRRMQESINCGAYSVKAIY